jgi:nitrate/TMAO reductase-like tetraheme cytochrome c subunit
LALPTLALFQTETPDTTFERFVRGLPTVEPPVPDKIASIFAFIFNAPTWMWVVGIVVGVVGGAWLLYTSWVRRVALREWFVTRNRGAKLLLLGSFGGIFLFIAVAGTASWNYMQHDNDFCSSCHVMEGPWNKFANDAGKHSVLQCHDCHQQSIVASTRELVLWVANKPEEIPPHSPVPNARCESCHNTEEDEMWTRVAQTAGHRTHMESDSTALAEVQCVTCHGEEVHAFIPASRTCGNSGCHEGLQIKLGKMAQQTALHCNQCHQFTAEVPRLATRDSAAGTMRPGRQQCLGCHEMQRVLTGYVEELEPHNSTCGTCHNPHTQETPQEAGKTCTTAGCHDNWQQTPFHTGTSHRRVGEQCLTCHAPHASKVDPSDCVACHAAVRERGGAGVRRLPPMPFDTARVLRTGSATHRDTALDLGRGKGDVRPPDLPPPARPADPQPAATDTFPHRRHTSLACITCHVSPDAQSGGRLTFEAPRGCQICHHQAAATSNCAACHRPETFAARLPTTIAVTTPRQPARERVVLFAHPEHTSLRCTDCHTVPVTLAPVAGVRQCATCHGDHHTAGRTCAACHTTAQLQTAHRDTPTSAHRRCDACHTQATVARLVPDRSFCLTCHTPEQTEHYPARECTSCHMLTSPEGWRPQLLGGAT